MYDIAVLGATPAGYAAACYLAARRCDVAVVDAPQQPIECPLADWVPADFFRIAGLPKHLSAACGAAAFHRVAYHNARFDRTVEHRSRGPSGYFLHRAGLVKAFQTAAIKMGVKVRGADASPTICLEEDCVHILRPVKLSARLLIIAQNRPNDVIGELSLPVRTVPQSPLTASALNIPLTSRAQAGRLAGVLHVVELPERSDLGMFFTVGPVVHLRVISGSPAAGTRAAEMSAMLAGLQKAGILPAELPLSKARGAVWQPPAGVALELETHVAKRCLLVGSAGGFADSITGHTLSPSVKSAILAAEVVLAAMKADNLQETLMRYKTHWRKSLADYLRPPNTSLGMLLPLLFVNQRIVARFTRALLHGESI